MALAIWIHANYYLTTWPSDIGMYPLALIFTLWKGMLVGGFIGTLCVLFFERKPLVWLVWLFSIFCYPVYLLLTIPILHVIEIILKPYKA